MYLTDLLTLSDLIPVPWAVHAGLRFLYVSMTRHNVQRLAL